jgi:hypothetical protein
MIPSMILIGGIFLACSQGCACVLLASSSLVLKVLLYCLRDSVSPKRECQINSPAGVTGSPSAAIGHSFFSASRLKPNALGDTKISREMERQKRDMKIEGNMEHTTRRKRKTARHLVANRWFQNTYQKTNIHQNNF